LISKWCTECVGEGRGRLFTLLSNYPPPPSSHLI
jgi:hypothetical protein